MNLASYYSILSPYLPLITFGSSYNEYLYIHALKCFIAPVLVKLNLHHGHYLDFFILLDPKFEKIDFSFFYDFIFENITKDVTLSNFKSKYVVSISDVHDSEYPFFPAVTLCNKTLLWVVTVPLKDFQLAAESQKNTTTPTP